LHFSRAEKVFIFNDIKNRPEYPVSLPQVRQRGHSKMTTVLLVYCTCPEDTTAAQMASALVEERLAACANRIAGMSSTFRWKGKVHTDSEVQLLLKTTDKVYPALEKRILELHPYELPEVLAVPVHIGLAGYVDWIIDSVSLPGDDSASS
jgi:periplasmic divalent cation tolerance protein